MSKSCHKSDVRLNAAVIQTNFICAKASVRAGKLGITPDHNHSGASLADLPAEMLEEIMMYFDPDDFSDWECLSKLRMTNHQLEMRTRPHVFKSIPLWLSSESLQTLDNISTSAHIAPHVRKLLVGPTEFPRVREQRESYDWDLHSVIHTRHPEWKKDKVNEEKARYDSECHKLYSEQTQLAQEGCEGTLFSALKRLPNLETVEVRLDNEFIGSKEIYRKLLSIYSSSYHRPYEHSCDLILPSLLHSLTRASSQLRALKLTRHNKSLADAKEGSRTTDVHLDTSHFDTKLSEDAISNSSSHKDHSVTKLLQNLEEFEIFHFSDFLPIREYTTFDALSEALMDMPLLSRLTLRGLEWCNHLLYDDDLEDTSSLLRECHFAHLTHFEIGEVSDRHKSLQMFLISHNRTLTVIRLVNTKIWKGNLEEPVDIRHKALRRVRESSTFDNLKIFEIREEKDYMEESPLTLDATEYMRRKEDLSPLDEPWGLEVLSKQKKAKERELQAAQEAAFLSSDEDG
ncbi:uncharacterized protein KY384_008144 [Bacidia gigantensis]|uniref:uncharacterized protein n=1 Tax=Bacidia gigantensis TaxID=2732470 RepID=UPI001D0541EF|nr:uncharacterized protein KY384_008144 [Bacidia gigantensis]KAG8526715.1 hypothetical protein KY384_008144 [Bacidia gigantensis]